MRDMRKLYIWKPGMGPLDIGELGGRYHRVSWNECLGCCHIPASAADDDVAEGRSFSVPRKVR